MEITRRVSSSSFANVIKPYQVQTLFDPSLLFEVKPAPEFVATVDMESDFTKDQTDLFALAVSSLKRMAENEPEFTPQTEAYAWPGKIVDNKIYFQGTSNIPKVMQDYLSAATQNPVSGSVIHGPNLHNQNLDAMTLRIGHSNPGQTFPNEWFLVVLIDLNKNTTFAEILTAIAHEYFGHIYLSLVLHDSVGSDKEEIISYTRSIRFLEMVKEELSTGQSDPTRAAMIKDIEAAIASEKYLLSQYQK